MLAKSAKGGFTYLTIWADGRQGLRFHDKAWRIEGRAPVTALVTSGEKEFEFVGNPASTSNGDAGLYGISEVPVLQFLAADDPVIIEANGLVLGKVMTDGLAKAFPLLQACGADLPEEERKELPSGTPASMIAVPTIPADVLASTGSWKQARYELVVGTGGTVSDCQIIEPDMDDAKSAVICDAIAKSARFRPARLSNGQAIEAKLQGSIRR